MLWDVFHQYTPYREVCREGVDRFYAPAVFWRGTVEAGCEHGAITIAIRERLSVHPIVRRAGS